MDDNIGAVGAADLHDRGSIDPLAKAVWLVCTNTNMYSI